MPDCGREKALGNLMPVKTQLSRAVYRVADLFPVEKVGAVENRNSRKVRESGVNQIKIIFYPAN